MGLFTGCVHVLSLDPRRCVREILPDAITVGELYRAAPGGVISFFFWTSKPVGGGFRSPRETHSRALLSLTTTYHENTQSW